MYRGVDRIARLVGSRVDGSHQFEYLRRICFLALAVQALVFDVKNLAIKASKTLEAYNLEYSIAGRSSIIPLSSIFLCLRRWERFRVPASADLLQ